MTTIGFIPIARTTFDVELAESVTAQARTALGQAGFSLAGTEQLVTSLDEAQKAAHSLAGQPLDLLLIFQATFADTSMVMALAEAVDVPLLLWAVPEALTGGRLRLNSLCGVNLAAHGLTRAGRPYEYVYAAPDETSALDRARAAALAGRVIRRLRGARIGRVGEHPGGFPTCAYDAEALKQQLGVEVVQLELGQVFAEARQTAPEAVGTVRQRMSERVDGLDRLDSAATNGTLGTAVALRNLGESQRLDGFAVRCWPEFFTELGCAACGAMSLLSDEGTPCSCEADVNGTVTQLILQELSGEPALGCDVVALDAERDGLVLWHCGLAPLSMADPESRPNGTIHSNRKLPLLMEFPLKPGRVTAARLSEASGSYRLVVGGGEMQRAPKSFSGTSGVLRFDRPAADVLDGILSNGLEHHLSLTYGDYVPALLSLARLLKLPVLRL